METVTQIRGDVLIEPLVTADTRRACVGRRLFSREKTARPIDASEEIAGFYVFRLAIELLGSLFADRADFRGHGYICRALSRVQKAVFSSQIWKSLSFFLGSLYAIGSSMHYGFPRRVRTHSYPIYRMNDRFLRSGNAQKLLPFAKVESLPFEFLNNFQQQRVSERNETAVVERRTTNKQTSVVWRGATHLRLLCFSFMQSPKRRWIILEARAATYPTRGHPQRPTIVAC